MTDDLSRIHYRPDLYDTDADAWAAQREEDRGRMMVVVWVIAALSGVFACACVAAVGFAVGVWKF